MPLIAACSSVASVGKVMALGCTVVSAVTRLMSRVRSASQLGAEPLAPVAQVRALVWKLMLEELFAGEVKQVAWCGCVRRYLDGSESTSIAQQQQKPNILFIMGDDIGWMQPHIYHRGLMVGETPNID